MDVVFQTGAMRKKILSCVALTVVVLTAATNGLTGQEAGLQMISEKDLKYNLDFL